MNKGTSNPRLAAVLALIKMESDTVYSEKVLDEILSKSALEGSDRRLAARIFYGCVSRKITLETIISQYSSKPANKLDNTVAAILKSALYQLLWLDTIPDNAAVDESVKLTKALKQPHTSGFVNAVLRSFLRAEKAYKLPDEKFTRLSVEYSVNTDIARLLCESFPDEIATDFLENSFEEVPVFVAVNTLKCNTEEIAELTEKYTFTQTILPNVFIYKNSGIVKSKDFKKGKFYIQDLSSALACYALNPLKNERILDICAAPGSKSFTMACLSGGNAEIIACDISENRTAKIIDGSKRLGISSVKAYTADGRIFNDKLGFFDKILCDVPCSGLGVIRRKPEIRYKSPADFAELPQIQYEILENAAHYAKPGTEIIYSTCTLNPAENEAVVTRFLDAHPEFETMTFNEHFGKPFGKSMVTLFPHDFGGDGFFTAKLKKTKNKDG
ncbi:MAG: 16S rRNA (cytosine(967)-C(5))-methyltransferase RsmB [Ruminococcus sp.]|jgi:16S rRNA (cytosine967-C5)-methyltransferase|nr:16S rRNA (cytosine(967)-C(5))-methyltransferase RsmB [Ruminococcus sp.]